MILHLWEKNQESHLFLYPLKPRLKKTQAQLGIRGTDHEVFTQLKHNVPDPKICKRTKPKSLMVVTALL